MAKVLVVDDEKLIVKGIRFSLEQDGMEVDCAYDGEEAIRMAKETEYDIVLLDVMLPKYDGYEVCQAIREFSDMPIIMLTAKGGDMDKPQNLIHVVALCRQHDDRHLGELPDGLADLITVKLRQHHIEEHHIIFLLLR